MLNEDEERELSALLEEMSLSDSERRRRRYNHTIRFGDEPMSEHITHTIRFGDGTTDAELD